MQPLELKHIEHRWSVAPVCITFGVAGALMAALVLWFAIEGEPGAWQFAIALIVFNAWMWGDFIHAIRYRVHRWVRFDEEGITVSDWGKVPIRIRLSEVIRLVEVKERWDQAPNVTIVHGGGSTDLPPRIGLGRESNVEQLKRWCEAVGIEWLTFPLGNPAPPEVFHR